MAESKKKSPGSGDVPNHNPDPISFESSPLSELLSHEELEKLSALQLVDLIASKLPNRHSSLLDLVYLRERVSAMEDINFQASAALEKMDAIVEKLRSPAFRVGTLLMTIDPDKAHVCVGGTDYVCRVDPAIPLVSLQVGQRVLCNEAFAVVQALGFDRNGPIVRIDELLSDGRLKIGQESGMNALVILRSSLLTKEKLKAGLEVRLDSTQRVALEVIGVGKRVERLLETVKNFHGAGWVVRMRRSNRSARLSRCRFFTLIFSRGLITRCPKVFFFMVRLVVARRCWARPQPTTFVSS